MLKIYTLHQRADPNFEFGLEAFFFLSRGPFKLVFQQGVLVSLSVGTEN